MGEPAARLTDLHTCPLVTGVVPHVGGPIASPGCPTVLIGGLPAARVTDIVTCVGPPDLIAKGSATVFIGGLSAARMGDLTAHGSDGDLYWMVAGPLAFIESVTERAIDERLKRFGKTAMAYGDTLAGSRLTAVQAVALATWVPA